MIYASSFCPRFTRFPSGPTEGIGVVYARSKRWYVKYLAAPVLSREERTDSEDGSGGVAVAYIEAGHNAATRWHDRAWWIQTR